MRRNNTSKLNKKQEQANLTRNKIIDTTRAILLNNNDTSQLTVSMITNLANISRTSFYTYFESVGDLMIEMYALKVSTFIIDMNALESISTCKERLLTYGDSVSSFYTDTEVLAILSYSLLDLHENASIFKDDNTGGIKIIENIITQGQEKGEFKSNLSSREIAEMIRGIINGTVLNWIYLYRSVDLSTRLRQTIKVFVDGLI